MPFDLSARIARRLARGTPDRLLYPLADLAADLTYLCWRPGRRRIRRNLAVVLNTAHNPTLDYWGQRQLRRYAEYLVDTLRLPSLTPAHCHAALQADPADWDRVRELAAQGPLIFALLHQGNWDIAGGAFTHNVGPSTVLVESLGHPSLDAAVQQQRQRLGMHVVYDTDPRAALRALRPPGAESHGGALGLLFDRPLAPPGPDNTEPGVDVRFCGAPCRLPSGLARLALTSSARVIPMAVIRTDSRALRFRVEIGLDFDYAPTGNRDHPVRDQDARDNDVRALTQSLLDWFEPHVRRHPDQWYMFRRFFRAAPTRTLTLE